MNVFECGNFQTLDDKLSLVELMLLARMSLAEQLKKPRGRILGQLACLIEICPCLRKQDNKGRNQLVRQFPDVNGSKNNNLWDSRGRVHLFV